MSETIVFDVVGSSKIGAKYWNALKAKAQNECIISKGIRDWPDRFFVWPILIYSRSKRTSEEINLILQERPVIFDNRQLVCPTLLLQRLPEIKKLLEFPLIQENELRSAYGEALSGALLLIYKIWPEAFKEFSALIDSVAWFSNADRFSYSSPKTFGCIFLNPNGQSMTPLSLATSIIHETGHHALFVETTLDALIPQDFAKPVYSPLRGSSRPAIGCLHALMAMARMLIWADKLCMGDQDCQLESTEIYKKIRPHFKEALDAMKGVVFSERGQKIILDFKTLESSWPSL